MAKHHNWTTGPNQKSVDVTTDRMATAFIDRCAHLTPVAEAELDNLLVAEVAQRNVPDPDDATMVCEPDPEVIKAMAASLEPDWRDAEPGPEAYEYDGCPHGFPGPRHLDPEPETEYDQEARNNDMLKARAAFES